MRPQPEPGQKALALLCNTDQTFKEEQHCYGTALWVLPFPASTTHKSPPINMPSPRQSQSRTLKILITCHNGPQEQEGTKQEVSCLCLKAIHDLPLANGEGNTKNLQTKVMSSCTVIIKQSKLFPIFTKITEHTGQSNSWPSEAKVWL